MQDTKEKIVGMADQLIKTRGFNAFSYKDISDPLAIKNAAIHYHFPGKADLGLAVIEKEITDLEAGVASWALLPEDQQLKNLVYSFENKCEHGLICIMGSLSPDYETLPPTMQERLKNFSAMVLEWTTECLQKGRDKQIFAFKGEPYDRALLIVSNLLASLLLTRVMGPGAFERISRQLLADILV